MSTYENNMYFNHNLNSEESEDISHLYSEDDTQYNAIGGAENNETSRTKDMPTGGFPPIFIVDNAKEKPVDKNKLRQITTNKTTVSIRDILKSKK